jgi:hypothetical protein
MLLSSTIRTKNRFLQRHRDSTKKKQLLLYLPHGRSCQDEQTNEHDRNSNWKNLLR